MSRVLFLSSRLMPRCENITAVYNAWDEDKYFEMMRNRSSDSLENPYADYDLVITDELVCRSKAPVIMIGHGISGGKTYLLQRKNRTPEDLARLLQCSSVTSCAIATSDYMVPTVQEQVGITNVLPLGMPRTDGYFSKGKLKKKGDGKTLLANYKSYLYAPTFRFFGDTKLPDIDLHKIDAMLNDDELFVVKPHMIFNGGPNKELFRHVVFFSKDLPSSNFLIDCDVLVTDYSSIMLDAHVLEKPVVLYEKDWNEYKVHANMTMDYPYGYSSRHCNSEEELVALCRDAVQNGRNYEDWLCYDRTGSSCDGHSTERLIKLMKKMLEKKD